jgi:hypothetical protein
MAVKKFRAAKKTFQSQDEVEGTATKKFRAMKKLFNLEIESKERWRKISARWKNFSIFEWSRRSGDEKIPRGGKTFRCRDQIDGAATKIFRAAKKLFDLGIETKERRWKIFVRRKNFSIQQKFFGFPRPKKNFSESGNQKVFYTKK